jgi:hypothetical protein
MNMKAARLAAFSLFMFTVAALAQSSSNLKITNGPIIEAVSNRSAVIAWSTNTGGSSAVKWGTDPNNLNKTAQSPYSEKGEGPHRVKIEPLEPGTTYYFQVVSGQGQGTGSEAKSEVKEIRTLGSVGTLKPLYRMVNGTAHLFTTSFEETKQAQAQGFQPEGIGYFVAKEQMPGTVPLYRLHNASTGDHFYTRDEPEARAAATQGYTNEGVAGYINPSQAPGTVPLYRLQNPSNNHHFYTTSAAERSQATASGWKDEGVAGFVWSQGDTQQ